MMKQDNISSKSTGNDCIDQTKLIFYLSALISLNSQYQYRTSKTLCSPKCKFSRPTTRKRAGTHHRGGHWFLPGRYIAGIPALFDKKSGNPKLIRMSEWWSGGFARREGSLEAEPPAPGNFGIFQ